MAQTCSRVATIRQSLLNDFHPEEPLRFPRELSRKSKTYLLIYTPDTSNNIYEGNMLLVANPPSIHDLSNEQRDRLSDLTLRRIENIAQNIDEYDGEYLEI